MTHANRARDRAGALRWWMLVPGGLLLAGLAGLRGGGAGDDPVDVAVAANFAEAQELLARRFEQRTGYRVRASVASTAQLHAHIRNGAPFDVFLSADEAHPRSLERAGLAVPGTRFTYSIGRLALYRPGGGPVSGGAEVLRAGGFRHLAIASPELAPYGAAAAQVLSALGLRAALADRLVWGQNIGQAYQFVESGAAELGLVALSQVARRPRETYWVVPPELHEPIAQEAVLLGRAASDAAAVAYLEFLRSDEARRLIRASGYDLP